MKIALVYDRVNKIGGAERVLCALHEIFPDAPLYTAVYNPKQATWARGWEVHASFLNSFPLARTTHELYPWLTPLAFETLDLSSYDLVISVTSAEAKGIITKPTTAHLCYCLTPTRYLWSDHQLHYERLPVLLRPLTKPVFSYLRAWDKIASQRPDRMIAISKTVQQRITKYYQRQSEVIYPPVDVEKFRRPAFQGKRLPFEDYFLLVSRLVPYKRLDIAVEAAKALNHPLVIVGTGMDEGRLKRLAGKNVTFVSKLTDGELVLYYQRCRALIFPQEEDFGLTVVEAQAAGKPVIAFNKGGATEIIQEGKTGLFFSRQSATSLIRALREFESTRFDDQDCRRNVLHFNKERFIKEFSSTVEDLWQKYKEINAR